MKSAPCKNCGQFMARSGNHVCQERANPEVRFWAFVDKAGECWLWLGSITRKGYGHFRYGQKLITAHRYAYELTVGPIPEGLTLDHLCSVKACVNPQHLEPVSNRDNTLRGNNLAAQCARRTHCKNGHEFTKANTSLRPPTNWRRCLVCARAAYKRHYERIKERTNNGSKNNQRAA